jgi:hypothetical protein
MEVRFAVQLYGKITKQFGIYVSASKVSVITPYAQQAALLRRAFLKNSQSNSAFMCQHPKFLLSHLFPNKQLFFEERSHKLWAVIITIQSKYIQLICFKVERQTLSSFRVSEPQVAKELDS